MQMFAQIRGEEEGEEDFVRHTVPVDAEENTENPSSWKLSFDCDMFVARVVQFGADSPDSPVHEVSFDLLILRKIRGIRLIGFITLRRDDVLLSVEQHRRVSIIRASQPNH